jgi:uncharacterized protein with PIN domain
VSEPTVIEEREFEDAILHDRDGRIIFNAAQQDDVAIRRKYSDGTIQMFRKSTGAPITSRYDPLVDLSRCPHCNEVL